MAKVVGLVGSASGKLGNVVYAVTNGIQVARVYQPVVSNPKSGLQTMQRAKGNLAGRISGFTPRTAIMGLGNNNRARRGEFLRNILKRAVVVSTASGYNAKIDNNDVLFSRGSVILSVVNPSVVNATRNSIVISLSGPVAGSISSDDYAALQTRIVCMVYDAASQELVEVVTAMANKPAIGGTANTELLIAHGTGYSASIYAIPIATSDGSAVSIDTDLAKKNDSDIAAALSVNGNAVVFNYGKSIYLLDGVYTPA